LSRSNIYEVAYTDDIELDVYLATRAWRCHSGAYAILEKNDPYVRVVKGSITNVIGLPLESLAQHLRLLGL
jgi:septum formation protein